MRASKGQRNFSITCTQCYLTQCYLTQCYLTQCYLTQRRDLPRIFRVFTLCPTMYKFV